MKQSKFNSIGSLAIAALFAFAQLAASEQLFLEFTTSQGVDLTSSSQQTLPPGIPAGSIRLSNFELSGEAADTQYSQPARMEAELSMRVDPKVVPALIKEGMIGATISPGNMTIRVVRPSPDTGQETHYLTYEIEGNMRAVYTSSTEGDGSYLYLAIVITKLITTSEDGGHTSAWTEAPPL